MKRSMGCAGKPAQCREACGGDGVAISIIRLMCAAFNAAEIMT
jgi:hypothetical protein